VPALMQPMQMRPCARRNVGDEHFAGERGGEFFTGTGTPENEAGISVYDGCCRKSVTVSKNMGSDIADDVTVAWQC
jgi:hypothetical protein